MRSIQARMPPFRFHAFVKPEARMNVTALALRPPERQYTTVWTSRSSSPIRSASVPSGIRSPPISQISQILQISQVSQISQISKIHQISQIRQISQILKIEQI